MRKLCALFILLLAASAVGATAISGSMPLVFLQLTQNGPNLLASTDFTAASTETSGAGTGDFLVVPLLTLFGPINLLKTMVTTGGGFAISNAAFGTFQATSGQIVFQSTNFLNIELEGEFDPSGLLGGFDPTTMIGHITLNQTGSSISGAMSLASIPEPSSLALCGSGLLFLAGWTKKFLCH